MAYEVEYSDLDSPETIQKALNDCRKWLGDANYKKVCNMLTADKRQTAERMVFLGLAMVGIQGYPAKVMIDVYWR